MVQAGEARLSHPDHLGLGGGGGGMRDILDLV